MAKIPQFAPAALWILAAFGLSAQPTIIEYSVPTAASGPGGISTGPDGNLWFTETDGNKIGTITTGGQITEFAIPTPNSRPWAIAAGPDGNLWFTEIDANQIGRITPAGLIVEYQLPNPRAPGQSGMANGITAGPDGNIWFTEPEAGKIGRITASGLITEYQAGTSSPIAIAVGPDGNLWFTGNNGIGQITPAGGVTQYPLIVGVQFGLGQSLSLSAIVAGPDGSLWIPGGSILWRVSTSGAVTSYSIAADAGIAVGADGNLWFTYGVAYEPWTQIGKFTMAGVSTEYSIPTSEPFLLDTPQGREGSMAPGPDGNLWFTEQAANKIAKLVLSTVPPDTLLNINAQSLTFSQVALGSPPAVQSLTVTASQGTTYTISADTVIKIGSSWLTVSPSGNLAGSQTFTAAANLPSVGTFGTYTGDITLVSGGSTRHVPVTLNIVRPLGPQTIAAVVNAGSFGTGAIAPGEIVSIFGTSLGPASPLGLALDSSGKVATQLGGVMVDFNGYLAPLTYVSSTQINCVVPYEIAGNSTATVKVFYLNKTSPDFTAPLADAAPSVFTSDGSGKGPAAALNSSGGLNGPGNPRRWEP